MKIVALVAALGMSAAATASVKPVEPARSSLLVLTSYKAPAPKQQMQKAPAAKPTPYIYKAPMATRPLKTW